MIGRFCVLGIGTLLVTAAPGRCGGGIDPGDGAMPVTLADEVVVDELVVEELDVDIAAGEPAAADEEEKKPKLSADEEKAFGEFVKKAGESRREQLKAAMEKTVSELVEVTKLDSAGKEKLEALVPRAVDASMDKWDEKFREWVLPMLIQSGDAAATLKQWKPFQFATNNKLAGVVSPAQTVVWKEGVKQILTAEQWSAQEVAEKARRLKVLHEMDDYLTASGAQAGDALAQAMDAHLKRFLQSAEIDEERQKKLKQAADAAVKSTLTAWRQRAENIVLEMDDKSREQISRQTGNVMGVDTTDKANRPDQQQVWQDAVAQILTESERKLLDARRAEIRIRRANALTMSLIADLDRLVGFSETQRTKLRELGGKRMLSLPERYFDSPDNGYYSIDQAEMLQQIKRIEEKQLSGVLDAGQLKRWKAITPEQLSGNRMYARRSAASAGVKAPEVVDEFEAERMISGILHREVKAAKQKMLAMMESRVENISRVAQPAAETVTVLRTAAKGAAEQLAFNSISPLEQWVRQQLQGLKPADIPARLRNFSLPNFAGGQAPGDPQVWTAAVNRLLTPQQREAWKTESDAREAWRIRSLSAMVLTEVEKRVLLKPEQIDALQKKLDAVIRDYEPDFSSFFSFGWHLQGYYCTIPLAILTDKEMEEIFDKKQLETVKERCMANILQYAEMLRKQHEQRTGKSSTK